MTAGQRHLMPLYIGEGRCLQLVVLWGEDFGHSPYDYPSAGEEAA